MSEDKVNKNICVIAIGMSGTGKTTFVNVIMILPRNYKKKANMFTALT